MEPSCPIQTKNHFEHDEKIRELVQEIDTFKFVTERTPRLLAQHIIDLNKQIKTIQQSRERASPSFAAENQKLRQENADLIKQMREIHMTLQEAMK